MPGIKLRIWFLALLALPLAFTGVSAWASYEGGWVITAIAKIATSVGWIAACLALMWICSVLVDFHDFRRERAYLAARAGIQCTFGLAAIAGGVFGVLLGMLAGIDYLPPDAKLAQDYASLFVMAAALSFVPVVPIALFIALLIPRFWNSHLSLVSQEGSQHAKSPHL